MSKAGERLLEGAREAVAISRGEKKPARIYVPGEFVIKVEDIAPFVGPQFFEAINKGLRPRDAIALEALLWAWTNATGLEPDENTMSADEIDVYWSDYLARLERAIRGLTGQHPDEYIKQHAFDDEPSRNG